MNRRKTGFDSFLEKRMQSPSFQKGFLEAKQEIDKKKVPGLLYYPEWIDEQTEDLLLAKIADGNWESTLQRRVQQFGAKYNYKTRQLDEAQTQEIPTWLKESLCSRLTETFFSNPTQVIINEYEPGQGITKHIDAPVFGPVIASLSLLSDTELTLGQYHGNSFKIPLHKRSLLVLSGDARSKWYHSISRVKEKRISLTFRTIL